MAEWTFPCKLLFVWLFSFLMYFRFFLAFMQYVFCETARNFWKISHQISYLNTLHEKIYFLFPNVQKRWSFEKNCTGLWSFLHYQERYLFFPKTWSYSLDRKWKMIFLKKIHGNVIFIWNVLKRWSFQKKSLSDIAFQWKKRKLNI